MTTTVDGVAQPIPLTTFKLLDDIIAILGSTKTTLWPFLESTGSVLQSYKENIHPLTAQDSGSDGFYPYRHRGHVNSLSFNASDDQYLLGEDHADFEFGDAANDVPFSVGCWIQPRDITDVMLLAKHDLTGAAEDREWILWLHSDSTLRFELYDESADATEHAEGTTAVTANEWSFVVMTYDGTEDDPLMYLYLNGAVDNGGTTTETGAYVAMEAGATPLMIGARLNAAAPSDEYTGRLALPFICGKELSASDVTALYAIGRRLLGLKA